MKVKSLSCVQLLATPWTAAYQAPPSMGFFQARVLEWVPLPSPLVPWPGIKLGPPALGVWSPSHWTTSKVPKWLLKIRHNPWLARDFCPLRNPANILLRASSVHFYNSFITLFNLEHILFFLSLFIYVPPHTYRILSSPTRDWTRVLSSESAES